MNLKSSFVDQEVKAEMLRQKIRQMKANNLLAATSYILHHTKDVKAIRDSEKVCAFFMFKSAKKRDHCLRMAQGLLGPGRAMACCSYDGKFLLQLLFH